MIPPCPTLALKHRCTSEFATPDAENYHELHWAVFQLLFRDRDRCVAGDVADLKAFTSAEQELNGDTAW